MPRISLPTVLALPFLFSCISAVFDTNCYLPSGNIAPGAYRCNNATSGHSSCCEIGSICWSNGVCQKVSKGVTDWIRLGCTDSTWEDPACLHATGACANITNAVGVRPCDGMSGTEYCCDLKPDDPGAMACCSTSSSLWSAPTATVEATVEAQAVLTYSSSASQTSSSASLTTPSQTSSSATNTSIPPATGSSGLSTGAKAGVGVGVALGAIAAAALGFFFFSHRRKGNKGYDPAKTNSPEPGNGNGQWTATPAYLDSKQPTQAYTYPTGQQQAWNPPATGELADTRRTILAELTGHEVHEMLS